LKFYDMDGVFRLWVGLSLDGSGCAGLPIDFPLKAICNTRPAGAGAVVAAG
jgi:hypothetical protein